MKSNRFTKIGVQYLNESIEYLIYSVLGSQARTKQSIYSDRASTLEAQQEFRSTVEDSILNYNVSTWINNMNRTITDTNIILNIAVSPSLWLLSNNLIILKNPFPGYNNRLEIANISVSFGYNHINREPTAKLLKNSGIKPTANLLKNLLSEPTVKPTAKLLKDSEHNTDLAIIFGGSLLSAYLFRIYVL